MENILQNYMIIIIVGAFLIFSLIGYLVDLVRNNRKELDEVDMPNIKPIEVKKIKEVHQEKETTSVNNNEMNTKDDLLENYNEDKSVKED